ncbi:zona pellucida glycoprotein 3d tandem duplicate 1 [Nerophis ophidion]|uniref:zona pellucida glycoprotein 3d tandem duplicate 1 n=1 Tax=Nerophis ophidion TaxID=159077 RepID=UPI002AE07A30|nr:zona pellucida glycoprotein 3d tandem duplicate 1 [Nerophis ophidion]
MLLLCGVFLLCCRVAAGGPPRPGSRSPGVQEDVRQSPGVQEQARLLPVFRHSRRPLVAKELLRPSPRRRTPLPAQLAALFFPRESPGRKWPPAARVRPVEVWCGAEEVLLRLDRRQLRAWPVPARFRLGSCQAANVTSDFVWFRFALTDCGAKSQVFAAQLVYTFTLYYTPPPQLHVLRVLPFVLPIHCRYNRFHYSYKVGFTPELQQVTFKKTIRSQLTFSLKVCTDDWESVPTDHSFVLGESVNFVAESGHMLPGEHLSVDSCYVTSSSEPNSVPKVDVISNYGCLTDSLRVASSSKFWSRKANMLKFSIDAFLFRNLSQVLYLHCSMSVALTISHTSKSCNYNKSTGRWEELQAPPSVCSCCSSTCGDLQDSVKNIVSSPGWRTRRQDDPSMKVISSQGKERVDQEEEKGKKVDLIMLDTSWMETDYKTEEIIEGDQEPRLEMIERDQEPRLNTLINNDGTTYKQGRKEKQHTDDQQMEPTPDPGVMLDQGKKATTGWMDNRTQNPNILGDLGSAGNISSNVISREELCSNIDTNSCPPTGDGFEGTNGQNTEEINFPASTEIPPVSNMLDNSQSTIASLDRALDESPEPTDYVGSKDLDGLNEWFQSRQIRGLERDQLAQFRQPMCVEGLLEQTDCISESEEGEVLHRGSLDVAGKTSEERNQYFAAGPGLTVSEEVLDKPQHSAVVIITSGMEESGYIPEQVWR